MKKQVVLFFVISDFEDIPHDYFTKKLNTSPNIIRIKGEMLPKRTISFHSNKWILHSPDDIIEFNDQLNYLIEILTPNIKELKKINSNYKCEFSCALYLFEEFGSTPIINFDSKFYDFISQVKINFEFDIYNPSSN